MGWCRSFILSLARPGERLALGYFFLLLFVVGAGLAIGHGVANTLFLKRYGVEYLPWIYLAQGLGLAAASFVYATLSDRVLPERILFAIVGTMVALLLVSWILGQSQWSGWAHPLLYLLQVIASEILALHFTLYIGSHFDAEQSKRLMPLALAGSQLGEVSGGLLLAVGAPVVGPANMTLLWLLSGVLALALVRAWHRRHGATRRSSGVRRGGSQWKQTLYQVRQGVGFARKSTLLRNSLWTIFYTVISLTMLGFLIRQAFVREYPRAEDLATVFGMVTFIGGGAAFLVQTLLTPRLIGRFGVRSMNLVFPVSTLLAMMMFLTPWSLFAAFAGSANRRVILPAIRNPARSLMWQALPDYMQGRVRGLTLAVVAPAAMLTAGLLVEALRELPGGIAGLGVAVALLAWHFSRLGNSAYMDTIVNTLKERLFVPRDRLARIAPERDNRFFAELALGLEDDDEAMAEGCARLLADHFGPRAVPAILARMDRASQPCRDRLARVIADHVCEQHADAWLRRLAGSDAHGRATMLGVAFRARWPQARPHVVACLAAANPRLVACGILGGLAYDDATLRAAAKERLQAMLDSDDEAVSTAALEMMIVMPLTEFRPVVCQALGKEAPRLLIHALHALDALRQPIVEMEVKNRIVEVYLGATEWPLRAACVKAMGLLPQPARSDSLILAIDDPQPQIQKIAADLLAAQGASWVAERLLDAMRTWHLGLRGQAAAITVLADMVPLARMRAIALDYLDTAGRYSEWKSLLDVSTGHGELLATVLTERVGQLADLGLRALALGPDRPTVEIVRAAINSDDRRQRMRCLDLLEDYADAEVREHMRCLLHPLAGLGGAVTAQDVVTTLTLGEDGWLARVAQQWSAA